jgi:hypothetical protein
VVVVGVGVAKVLRRNNGVQRTAAARDVTYLEAADFATRDKTDVPYGADELNAQQEFKPAKAQLRGRRQWRRRRRRRWRGRR